MAYTYSFLDAVATIAGPGGLFNLAGEGVGTADEGCVFEFVEDRGSMVVGADGEGMHSLHGGRPGIATVTLLKNSAVNALLSAMYNVQAQSAAFWGQNVIVCRHSVSGDVITLRQAAFQRHTPMKFGKEGGTNEWKFHGIKLDAQLGSGGF